MKKISLLLAFFVCIGINSLFAQNMQVTGTVTSGEDGSGIPGATVKVKGGTTGVVTDLDGKYTISVSPEATLVVSFVGLKTQEVAVAGQKLINVTLQSDVVGLDEVVVTAMGMKKSEKTIGYAAKNFSAGDIADGQSTNLMSSLAGKVSGVQISQSGGAGSSTKVIIRGFSSLSGSNQPLYVVDGVPINNSFSGNDEFSRSVDYGNGANDLNPEDIESISVLKGASATALYGSRASSGVIMVTTKRAKQNQSVKVSYSGSYGVSNILRVPQTQNVFGEGWGFWAATENGSWGPKYDGQSRPWGASIDPKTGLYVPGSYDANTGMYDLTTGGVPRYANYSYVKNNARNFYDYGQETNQSIQISGGNEISTYNLSYNYTGVDGIIPTDADKYNRHMISFRGNAKKGKFAADYSVNYVYKVMNAVSAGQGQSDGGATLWQEMLQTPGSVDIQSLKDYNNPYNNSDNFYTWYASNPYFVINENGNTSKENRLYGKVELSYEILTGLKAIARVGGDFQNNRNYEWGAIESFNSGSWSEYGAKSGTTGRYEELYTYNQQLDATGLLNFDYKLGEDWSLTGNAGMNWNQIHYSNLDSYVSGLNIPGWYSLANSSDRPITTSRVEGLNIPQRRLYAALGEFTLGYHNYLFLSGSARNDWSSTLPKGKNSYFYGGLNASSILTDMLPVLKNSVISFWKVRAAVGQTGKDAPIYNTNTSYVPAQVTLRSGNLYLPLGGVAGLTRSNILGNNNLRPEITTEWELGTQLNFFNNRVNWDITYYNKVTKDQIITANIGPETGYTRQTLNVGKISNKGFEVSLTLVPLRTKEITWDFTTNLTLNRSKVEELWGGNDKYLINSAYDVQYFAQVGKPLGVFYAPQAVVAPDTLVNGAKNPYAGYTVVNSSTGRPLIDEKNKEMGSSEPDFMLGFSNKVKVQNWTLSFAVDWRQGGKFYSYTQQLLNFTGNTFETTFNERQPFLLPHSVKKVGDKYVENDVNTTLTGNYAYWYANTNPVMYQHAILDKSYVKLREVTLTYDLPAKWFTKTSISSMSVSLYGRNLLLFTPAENNFVDPEATNFGNDLSGEFGEFAAGPSTRSYGVNLRLNF